MAGMMLERSPGEWTYDPEAKAAYVYLRGPIPDGGVARTVTAEGAMVNFDLDEEGRVVGVEIIAEWPDAKAEPGLSAPPI
jgi:uncharacterized protein YuzE